MCIIDGAERKCHLYTSATRDKSLCITLRYSWLIYWLLGRARISLNEKNTTSLCILGGQICQLLSSCNFCFCFQKGISHAPVWRFATVYIRQITFAKPERQKVKTLFATLTLNGVEEAVPSVVVSFIDQNLVFSRVVQDVVDKEKISLRCRLHENRSSVACRQTFGTIVHQHVKDVFVAAGNAEKKRVNPCFNVPVRHIYLFWKFYKHFAV